MTKDSNRRAPSPAGKRIRDSRDRRLLRRYRRTRDPGLREQLVERFLPLARSLAWRYRSSGEPIEDLVQVASEGLIRAIDGFDPAQRTRFSSYATPMILGALRHYFRDATQQVHVPRGMSERIQRVRSVAERTGTDLGDRRTPAKLAELTDLSEEQVRAAIEAQTARRTVSVDRLARGGSEEAEGRPMIETLGESDDGYDAVESELAAESAPLEDRERSVLELRYGSGMSQREVGDELGVSQMQVSRVQRRALRKLLDAVRGRPPSRVQGGEVDGSGPSHPEPPIEPGGVRAEGSAG